MLSERLKELRNEKEISQRKLADFLKISPSTIAMYETNQRDPDTDMLQNLADFFNVSVDYLLGRTDIRQPLSNGLKPSKQSELSKELEGLSPESQEEIRKLIELYKIKDMQDRNKDSEFADEISE